MRSEPMHRLESLADTLWAERHLVEFLLFKLTTAKLILAADERRYVALALDEVERVVIALRGAESRRAQAVAEAAAELHVDAERLTLSQLATHSPEPLRTVFRDHAEGFLRLATEIEETAVVNRRLASATLSHVQRALDALTGPPAASTYTASGRPTTATAAPMRLDQVL
jgi:hypothetical protein